MADPILSPEARGDLSEAWDAIAAYSVDAADRFLDAFWALASRHASFPRTGRDRSNLRPGLRSFVVGKHVVFFTADADTIRIVRVLFGSRDVDRILTESDLDG